MQQSSRSSIPGSPSPSHGPVGSEDAASSAAPRSPSGRFLPDLRSPEQVDAPLVSKTGAVSTRRKGAGKPRAAHRSSPSGGSITHVHVHTKGAAPAADGKATSPVVKPLPTMPPEAQPRPGSAAERKARKSRSSGAVSPAPDDALADSPRSLPSGSIGASPGADIALSPHAASGRAMQRRVAGGGVTDGDRDVLVRGDGSKADADAEAAPAQAGESIELNPAAHLSRHNSARAAGTTGGFGSAMSAGPPPHGATARSSMSGTRNIMMSPYNEVDTTALTDFAETSDLQGFAKPRQSSRTAAAGGFERNPSGTALMAATDAMQSSFMAEDRGVWAAYTQRGSGRGPAPPGLSSINAGAANGDTVAFAPSGELTDDAGAADRVENSWFADARMPTVASRPSPPTSRSPRLPSLAEAPPCGGGASPGNAFMAPLISPRVERDAVPASTHPLVESEFSAMADSGDELRPGSCAAARRAAGRPRGGRARAAARQGSWGRGSLPPPDALHGVPEHDSGDSGPYSSAVSSRSASPTDNSALRSPRVASVLDKMSAARRSVRRGAIREPPSPFDRSGALSGGSRRLPSHSHLKRSGSATPKSDALGRLDTDEMEAAAGVTPVTATSSARGRDSVRNRDLVAADSDLLSPQAEATMERVLGGAVAPMSARAVPDLAPVWSDQLRGSPPHDGAAMRHGTVRTLFCMARSDQPGKAAHVVFWAPRSLIIYSALMQTGNTDMATSAPAEGPLEPQPTPMQLGVGPAASHAAVNSDAAASAAAKRVVAAAAAATKPSKPKRGSSGARSSSSRGAATLSSSQQAANASVAATVAALQGGKAFTPVPESGARDAGKKFTPVAHNGVVERRESSSSASAKGDQQRHKRPAEHQQFHHHRTASTPAGYAQPPAQRMPQQAPPGMAWAQHPMQASAPPGMLPEMLRGASVPGLGQNMPHPGMMPQHAMARPNMGPVTPPAQFGASSRSASALGRGGGPRSAGRGGAAPSPELKALLGHDNNAKQHHKRLVAAKKQAQATHMQQMHSHMAQLHSQMRPGMWQQQPAQAQMAMYGQPHMAMHGMYGQQGMMQGQMRPGMWQQQAPQQAVTPPPPVVGDIAPTSSSQSGPATAPAMVRGHLTDCMILDMLCKSGVLPCGRVATLCTAMQMHALQHAQLLTYEPLAAAEGAEATQAGTRGRGSTRVVAQHVPRPP